MDTTIKLITIAFLTLILLITGEVFGDFYDRFKTNAKFQHNQNYILRMTYQGVTVLATASIVIVMVIMSALVAFSNKPILFGALDALLILVTLLLVWVWSIPVFMAYFIKHSQFDQIDDCS